MNHKILVTGTLDSGKTTLLNELGEREDVVVVREVAQDLIDQYGYQITQVPEFQDMVFVEQLAREEAAEAQNSTFILCDRGTVDIVAFCHIIGHPIKPEWSASLRERYAGVALFSPHDIRFQPELYQVPFDITEYRQSVDASIRAVLQGSGLEAIEIHGSHEQRLRIFNEFLERISLGEGTPSSQEGNISFWLSKERR